MLSKIQSLGCRGVTGYAVSVECHVSNGLPGFDIVGLPDAAVKEARERVRSAIKTNGMKFPVSRLTVNLAPADTRKAGTLYDLPVLLGNDADCAAVGEYFQGAGRGLRDFVVLTLGTGLGAGIILDGRLRGGESSSEAGHMVLHAGGEPCPCGRRGCWEQYASATALIRRTEAAMAAHPESALCRLAEEAGGVDGRTPFLAAEAGDETALAVCRAYVEELAEGTASLINILRPEAVAFGGGVAGAPEHLLLEPLRRRVGALCFSRHGGRATRILRAELGNDAGVIGAALLGRVI